MPSVTIRLRGHDALLRALGGFSGAITRGLLVAARRLSKDGFDFWRKVTPKRTGQLRRSMSVSVEYRRAGRSIRFHVKPPGSDYYNRVDRRHNMSDKLTKWFNKHARRYVQVALQRELDKLQRGTR